MRFVSRLKKDDLFLVDSWPEIHIELYETEEETEKER